MCGKLEALSVSSGLFSTPRGVVFPFGTMELAIRVRHQLIHARSLVLRSHAPLYEESAYLHAVFIEQESGKEEDVGSLLDDLESAADIHDACQRLQGLILDLRPSNDILHDAGLQQ